MKTKINAITLEEVKKKVIPILKNHGIPKAILFGSYIYGNMVEDSDIDIYVELPKDRTIGFEFFSIARELESK